MHAMPRIERFVEVPTERIEETSETYFRSIVFEKLNHIVGQHEHDHRHDSFVGWGRVRGWCKRNGAWVWLGDKGRGEAFDIEAGAEHAFMALEVPSLLACVHNIASADSVKRKGL